MLFPLSPTISQKRLIAQLVSGDNERTVRFRVSNVNNAEIATSRCLAHGHAGAVLSRSVLARILQNLFHLFIADVVIPDVRLLDPDGSEVSRPPFSRAPWQDDRASRTPTSVLAFADALIDHHQDIVVALLEHKAGLTAFFQGNER
jgi:hypothetical protein